MKQSELNSILRLHKLWRNGLPEGEKANLSSADLSGANLIDANLSSADLRYTDFSSAVGFDITYKYKAEFFVGISKKWDIVTVGCKTHTTLEWMSYIESGLEIYAHACRDEKSHSNCIKIIKEAINYIETN